MTSSKRTSSPIALAVPLAGLVMALSACATTGSTTAPDLYVDAAVGADTNPGTKAEPFKTIAAALAAADAGQAVVLEPGTYDEASGETWGYALASGAQLRAAASGVVLHTATGAAGFSLASGGVIDGVTFTGFDPAVGASGGDVTLDGDTFDADPLGVSATGSARVTLTGATFQGTGAGARLFESSALTMTGGSVTGLDAIAFAVNDNAHLELAQVTAQSVPSEVVSLHQSASATVSHSTISGSGPNTGGASASLLAADSSHLTLDHTEVALAAAYAVIGAAFGSTVDVQAGTIHDSGYGGINSTGTVSVDGATIEHNHYAGLNVAGALTVTNAIIRDNGSAGIAYSGTATLKVRGSYLTGNGYGVSLGGTGGTADLGTATDPGGNFVQSVSGGTGLNAPAWTNDTIQAVGNTWSPNVQGADAAGHYTSQIVTGPVSGQNITLGSGVALQL